MDSQTTASIVRFHCGLLRSASYMSFKSRSPFATSLHGWSEAVAFGATHTKLGSVPFAACSKKVR